MDPVLSIQDLTVSFQTDEGRLTAVDHLSFDVRPGEVLGLVGESGCGKSVTAMSVLRLVPRPPGQFDAGRIMYNGQDLLSLPVQELRKVRGAGISMIFQEPMTALSPLYRIGNQMIETIRLHRDIPVDEARQVSLEWMRKVGIPDVEQKINAFPFELSGGMRQRIMIAMALMLEPSLIIADEPTTALDVTIQAQVFDLIRKMKDNDTSMLLITHDMGVIWEMCDRVVVMYASRKVEEGPVKEIFNKPSHPYTQALLKSMPSLAQPGERLPTIEGQVPSPLNYPPGCRFCDRCPQVMDKCREHSPDMHELGPGHQAACHLLEGDSHE